jgi:hypothetical protein
MVLIAHILLTPTERTNYSFLVSALSTTLANQSQVKTLVVRYGEDDQALADAIQTIQQP